MAHFTVAETDQPKDGQPKDDRQSTGEPLVLVSGLAQVGERWRRVRALLRDEFTVVTVDNRECGVTGPCPEGFTLADLAGDVLNVMSGLGHERFFLAGISMGGMIAQEVARLAPERVRAAVLLATHGATPTAVMPPDLAILMPASEDPLEAARLLWTRLAGPGFAEMMAYTLRHYKVAPTGAPIPSFNVYG